MNLNLQRETLLKPLQMAIGVVERKQTMAILSNILLDVRGDKLSVTGTDTEVELIGQSTLDAPIEVDSQITLPGRKLIDICKALPDSAPIELYQEKEKVILKSGRSRFTLATLPAQEFPNVETKEAYTTLKIEQNKLRQLLASTAFSMAQQDVRYYLNGLMLEIKNGTLTAVATDGHRLAINNIDIDSQESHRIQIIIPRKGVLELMRLLSDSDESINVLLGTNHIRVISDDFTFTSKLIEGRFPDYDRVIPNNTNKTIVLNRDEFRQALSRTAILCNEKFHGIRLDIQKGKLTILSNNPEQEAAEEVIRIIYEQEDLEMGCNVNYLIEILNILHSDEVLLSLSGPDASMKITSAEDSDESVYVVMPMRL